MRRKLFVLLTIFLCITAALCAPVSSRSAVTGSISYENDKITVTHDAGTRAKLIIARYDGRVLRELTVTNVKIGSDGKAVISDRLEAGDKIMLWGEGMTPLADTCVVAPSSPSPSPSPEPVGYKLDHEDVTDITEIWKASEPSALKLVSGSEPYGKYMSYDFSGKDTNSKPVEMYMKLDTSGLDYYVVEFDAALTAGNDMPTTLAIKTSDFAYTGNQASFGVERGYLLKMEAGGGLDVWTLNDLQSTVSLNAGSWYHYKLIVNVKDLTAALTVTDERNKTITDGAVLPVSGDAADITGVYMLAGRKYAVLNFDNLTVRRRRVSDIIW